MRSSYVTLITVNLPPATCLPSPGGDYGYGTVFRVSPDGVETVIHSFNPGPTEGANPVGLIQGSDGNLYGTTQRGGMGACPGPVGTPVARQGENIDYAGCGTVFKVTLRGELTQLHAFSGGADGEFPTASLVELASGHFYGVTINGGIVNTGCTADGCGVVFSVNSAGTEQAVYSFNIEAGDGARPVGLSLGKDGNLYGTASSGGQFNLGAVFKLTPAGVHTVLYSFIGNAADSAQYPNGSLVQASDGSLYGTTLYGGLQMTGDFAQCEAGCGTVFKITPAGQMAVVFTFTTSTSGILPQGALIVGKDGILYGLTSYGGNTTVCPESGCGTVFALTAAGVESILSRLDAPVTGNAVQPRLPSSLIRSDSGDLYGTALGGDFGDGIVFKLSPTGDFTTLHSFRGPTM